MTTTYIVSWQEWKGVEPCGKTEWVHRSRKFTDYPKARAFFIDIRHIHTYVKLCKITNELLEESE